MNGLTIERVVHSHYANGRGMAMMVTLTGVLGLAAGGYFALTSDYDSDREVGLLILAAAACVTAIGGLWWWMRTSPTRTAMYRLLVVEKDRIVWVERTRFRGSASMYFFKRDDGGIVGLPLTWPGPGTLDPAALVECFRATYPHAMHGSSEENDRRYHAMLKERGLIPRPL
jgi:hypothetical protein